MKSLRVHVAAGRILIFEGGKRRICKKHQTAVGREANMNRRLISLRHGDLQFALFRRLHQNLVGAVSGDLSGEGLPAQQHVDPGGRI